MDMAFVDKLASQNQRVKCLLVDADIFSRFVRVQTMETKHAKDTLHACKERFLEETLLKNFGVINNRNCGIFEKFCKD